MHPYRFFIDRACRRIRQGTLEVGFWDGASSIYGQGDPHVRVILRRPGIVPGLLINPEMTFGDAYTRGNLEVIGSNTSGRETR